MTERVIKGRMSEVELFLDAATRGAVSQMDKTLSRGGVSPDCRDTHGRTPLILAARAGNAAMTGMLIRHKADVNTADGYGNTALMEAARRGHLPVVKMLAENGADVDLGNNEGMTAVGIAQEMDHDDVTAFLSAQSAGSTSPIQEEISKEPDDDGPTTGGPAGASMPVAAAMAPASKPDFYVQELDLESIPGVAESPYFKAPQESEIVTEDGEDEAIMPPQADESGADSPGTGDQPDEALRQIQYRHDDLLGSKARKAPAVPDNISNEQRVQFDALDNKQVRNICEKIKKVLDKAGFEVGDYVIDTVFKGSYIAVLKPRSQENKRWRKLKKHPDWVMDPRRLTELIGGCATRRLCLSEGTDVSSFSLSHFIELYYAKDLKMILTLAEEASTNKYTVRQMKKAVDDLREHKDDHDPGKEIIRTLDQSVPLLEDPDLMALCIDKDRVLEELSRAERKKIRALIKERKPGLDEWKSLMDTFEGILSDLEDE